MARNNISNGMERWRNWSNSLKDELNGSTIMDLNSVKNILTMKMSIGICHNWQVATIQFLLVFKLFERLKMAALPPIKWIVSQMWETKFNNRWFNLHARNWNHFNSIQSAVHLKLQHTIDVVNSEIWYMLFIQDVKYFEFCYVINGMHHFPCCSKSFIVVAVTASTAALISIETANAKSRINPSTVSKNHLLMIIMKIIRDETIAHDS